MSTLKAFAFKVLCFLLLSSCIHSWFKIFQINQYRSYVCADTNGLIFNLCGCCGLTEVDTGVGCPRILGCHFPKRILNDDRSVHTNAELQKQKVQILIPPHKIIIQRFVNYGGRIAIYGDYSHYTSKPLKDFIYESNKGKDIFFVSSLEEAVEKLTKWLQIKTTKKSPQLCVPIHS